MRESGKSYLVHRMLNHLDELFHPVPSKIVYCYGEYQKEFDEFHPDVELIQMFLNDVNELTKGHDNSLIVLDDLMSQCSNNPHVADLFTHGSHHRGISMLYLMQNLFPPGKFTSSNQCFPWRNTFTHKHIKYFSHCLCEKYIN